MPLREYKCDKCGKVDEVFFKTSEVQPEIVKCECGGDLVKSSISKTSFSLIGDSWSKDGYSNPQRKK